MRESVIIKRLATMALTGGGELMFRPASEENPSAVITNGHWLIFVPECWLPTELRYAPIGTYIGKFSEMEKQSSAFPNITAVVESARRKAIGIDWHCLEGMPIMVDMPIDGLRVRVYIAGNQNGEPGRGSRAAIDLRYWEALEALYPGATWKAQDHNSAIIIQEYGDDRAVVMPIRMKN